MKKQEATDIKDRDTTELDDEDLSSVSGGGPLDPWSWYQTIDQGIEDAVEGFKKGFKAATDDPGL